MIRSPPRRRVSRPPDEDSVFLPRRSGRLAAKSDGRERLPEAQAKKVLLKKWNAKDKGLAQVTPHMSLAQVPVDICRTAILGQEGSYGVRRAGAALR